MAVMEVSVKLIGDPQNPEEGIQGAPIVGDGRRYVDLPTAVITAEEEASLDLVLDMACDRFRVDRSRFPGPSWINFYRPEHDNAYPLSDERTSVILVDDLGRAQWNVSFRAPEVTLGALLRSDELGAFDGDPLKPYLILRPGFGNGVLPGWADYVELLLVMRGVVGAIADVHGATQVVRSIGSVAKRLFERLRGVPEVAADHREEWEKRRANSFDIEAFIDRQPWRGDVLAGLLGCSDEEAQILLSGRGFNLDQDTGLWVPDDVEGMALRRILRSVYSVEFFDDTPDGQGRIAARFEEAVIEALRGLENEEE